MKLFRLATFAMFAALMLPFGSSAVATITDTPPPPHHLTDSRALDLRTVGSQITIKAVENAIRQGGLALLGEGFQIDSSLGWVFGETVEGEIDAVLPLWNRDGHIVFAQPGAVFWTGFEEEERIDGNLGVVYRTETANGVIGGVSLFYDHDFQIGHSRLGFGVDAQRDGFYGAFNYYHPLSDTEDGREGYVEDALQGMDVRLAVESDVTRFGGNAGYWKFQGDEDVKDDWKLSYGIDAGLRIIPGVFLEGSLQRHDKDVSLGQRASVGLAFRFSLPYFEGKSYGSGGTTSNLYKIVEREKRILYEEREANSPVRLTPTDENGMPLASTSAIEEGSTVTVAGELEALPVPVMFELVIDEDVSSADLGDDFNYGHEVYVLDEATGQQSAPGTVTDCPNTTCEMMIPAGVTRFDVEIEILADNVTKEIPEEVVLQVNVPEEHQRMVRSGETRVTIQAHGNTVEFAEASSTLGENGGTVDVAVNADLAAPAPIRLNVSATSTDAVEDEDYMISSGNLTIPDNANGETASASLTLTGINNDIGEGNKTITLTIPDQPLPLGWVFGTQTTHTVTLLDDDLAIGFATPRDGDAFNPARVFEENPTSGMQQSVTVRVESTQAAPSEGFDLAWEVGSMEGGDQVTSTSGAVDFSSGDSHKEFTLTIDNDNMQEGETPVTVRLSTPTSLPTGWNFGVQEYTFTIETSDTHVSFASNVTDMTVNEGDTITFGLEIENIVAPSTGIPLRINFLEGNNAAGEDLRFEENHVIPAGQRNYSFTVGIIDDAVAENAEKYTITISSTDGFPNSWGTVTTNGHAITINGSDRTIGFTANQSYAPTTLLEGGTAGQVTIAIEPPPEVDVIIPILITVTSEDSVNDSLSFAPTSSSTLSNNIQTGLVLTYRKEMASETINIAPVSDADSTNEDITISIDGARHNFPDGYSLGEDTTRELNIIDDDGSDPIVRTLSFEKREGNVAEGGPRTIEDVRIAKTDGVQIFVSPELTADVSLPLIETSTPNTDGYSVSGGEQGSSYSNGMVGLDASERSDGVTLIIGAEDDNDSDNETVTFTIDAANLPPNYRVDMNNDTWTVTVHDDD